MMTNMALSLQCCVPRIQAGGLERVVGSGGGVRDGEKKMGARIWKWEREVKNVERKIM